MEPKAIDGVALVPITRTAEFTGTKTVRLTAHTSPDGVFLQIAGNENEAFSLSLRLRAPTSLQVTGSSESAFKWALHQGFRLNTGDPFAVATDEAYVRMYPKRELADEAARDTFKRVADEKAQEVMRQVFRELRLVAIDAAQACAPAERKAALRFPNHLRFWVYCRLVEDSSKRLLQLAAVCPGLLALVYAIREATRDNSAAEMLLAEVVAGRKLDSVLRDAAEYWASLVPKLRDEKENPIWEFAARRLCSPDAASFVARQRLLIRRAGPAVPATYVLLPPPHAFAPEDIPEGPRKNARWFRTVKSSRCLLADVRDLTQKQQASFARFVSRNALAIWTRRRPEFYDEHGVGHVVGTVVDFIRATGRVPERTSSPERFFAEVDVWHAQMARLRDVADAAATLGLDYSQLAALKFPESPLLHWADRDAGIVAIGTPQELIDEGREMHHCVASRMQDAASGTAYFFRAHIGMQRLTVELQRTVWGWVISEAVGKSNRTASDHERTVLNRWVSQLQARDLDEDWLR